MNSFANHIDSDELNLYIANKASRDQAESIKRHIEICDSCKDGLVAGLLQLMVSLKQGGGRSTPADKRHTARLESGESGYLQSISPLSFDRPAVQIADISKGGIGLFIDSQLAQGTIVQVCTGSANLLGEVASCVFVEGARYRVGIRVQSFMEAPGGKTGSSRRAGNAAGPDCDLIVG